MKKRRPLLREALSETVASANTADPFETEGTAEQVDADTQRVGILIRVSPELRRDLRIHAINRGTTVQAMVLAAIAELLKES